MYYLCYDAALNDVTVLLQLQCICEKNRCLFADTPDKDIWYTAPWLFECDMQQFQQINDAKLPLVYCILFQSQEYLKDITTHLQQFIFHTKEKKFTRIWDARALQRILNIQPLTFSLKFFALFQKLFLLKEAATYTQLNYNARKELVVKECSGNPYLNLKI